MISGQILFDDYCNEHNVPKGSSSVRYSKLKPSISQKRFVSLSNKLQSNINPTDYPTRCVARHAMVSKIGFIEFLIFRAIIYWIVDRILNYYFGAPGSTDPTHHQCDARVL